MIRLIIAILFTYTLNLQAEPSIKVTVDRSNVTINTVFTLTFEFNDFNDFPNFTPDIKRDFNIISGPNQSTSYSWINGVSSSIKKKSWSISANKTGKLQIPAFEFRYKKKKYRSRPVTITVTDPQVANKNNKNTNSKTDAIFIKSELSSKKAVAGEVISLQYRLYYRTKVINYSFDPIKSLPGFLVNELKLKKNPSVSKEIINGVSYNTAVLKEVLLVATEAGKHTIPPQRLRLEVQRNTSRRSIFDDPFFSSFNTQSVDIMTQAITILVNELPKGAPEGFSGAVGEFNLNAHVDTQRIEADQAVNFLVEVRGIGNLKNFSFVQPTFPEGFQIFDPRMKENIIASKGNYRGSKTWEYIFIPTEQGNYALPQVKFSYYNIRTRKYVTLTKNIPNIEVLPNSRIVEELQKGLTQQEVALLNEDIRYICTAEESSLIHIHYNPLISIKFWIMPLMVIFAILFHYLFELYYRIRMNDPVQLRKRNALKTAMTNLIDETIGIQERSRVFNNYFADKLNLQAGEVSAEILKKYFINKKLNMEICENICNILNDFDKLKFSPSMEKGPKVLSSSELRDLLAKAEAVL